MYDVNVMGREHLCHVLNKYMLEYTGYVFNFSEYMFSTNFPKLIKILRESVLALQAKDWQWMYDHIVEGLVRDLRSELAKGLHPVSDLVVVAQNFFLEWLEAGIKVFVHQQQLHVLAKKCTDVKRPNYTSRKINTGWLSDEQLIQKFQLKAHEGQDVYPNISLIVDKETSNELYNKFIGDQFYHGFNEQPHELGYEVCMVFSETYVSPAADDLLGYFMREYDHILSAGNRDVYRGEITRKNMFTLIREQQANEEYWDITTTVTTHGKIVSIDFSEELEYDDTLTPERFLMEIDNYASFTFLVGSHENDNPLKFNVVDDLTLELL
ncbi:hypothetical protein BKI52_02570 [marine bacterium AO1-C]|nr:hypothetical protein BKI52_02570 [marine bacterium AO1-C]